MNNKLYKHLLTTEQFWTEQEYYKQLISSKISTTLYQEENVKWPENVEQEENEEWEENVEWVENVEWEEHASNNYKLDEWTTVRCSAIRNPGQIPLTVSS